MPMLTTTSDGFALDGAPYRIISGAMHYFRIHPGLWVDRLRKARLMGLNTVETYLPWNLHQPTRGRLDLDGLLNLPRYLRLAQEEGLHVLLRPGPYIYAEWDNGGLPHWLTVDRDIRIDSSDPCFTAAVDRYFDLLIPALRPWMGASGGPVIGVQVENRYDPYDDDPSYLEYLCSALRSRGVEEFLFTCDQADPEHLAAGRLPGIFATASVGSRVTEALSRFRAHQARGPLMCAEFRVGSFDRWGGAHHVRDTESTADDLDALLAAGASVNIYMFHGGTNFGFTNGANHEFGYTPTVTSYDYDAPLTEAGDPGPKYHAFREVISRYAPVPDEPSPRAAPKLPPVTIPMEGCLPLLDFVGELADAIPVATPCSMDELGVQGGFVLYRTTVSTVGDGIMRLNEVGDRAQIFVDGAPCGVLERERHEEILPLRIPRPMATLDVLVENLGRVNYGAPLQDRKGLLGPVTFNGTSLTAWNCYPLPLDAVPLIPFVLPSASVAAPAFHHGTFEVTTPADTFLALPGWTKGCAWVNGFPLGRYWQRGPQRTLYVPGPSLRAGTNDLVLLELHATTSPLAQLTDVPDLGAGQL
ncbi:glycoside hydrolase family 35 protein [Streptomyces decoyicus]|uniref:glycoside hydrolase family 35 protein n=1 Tax=Streptomyces decoyicus TaxID=249567 RepID=UPI00364A837A